MTPLRLTLNIFALVVFPAAVACAATFTALDAWFRHLEDRRRVQLAEEVASWRPVRSVP